jgi:hypothetical protein
VEAGEVKSLVRGATAHRYVTVGCPTMEAGGVGMARRGVGVEAGGVGVAWGGGWMGQ